MKFLIQWQLHSETRHETLAAFANMSAEDDAAMMGEGVKLLGRWHDLVSFTGVAIVESDSAEAVSAYALRWNAHMDIEVTPVLDDEETRRVGQAATAT